MDHQLDQLEDVLRRQLAGHDRLLTLLRCKHEALRRHDRDQLIALCEQENHQVQAIAEMEKDRLMLTGALTAQLDPTAQEPLRLLELATRVAEPRRGRLLVLRQQLRQRIAEVQHEAGVARRATEALARHVQGIMQTVGTALGRVGTYGMRGNVPKAALSVSTFNATA